MSSSVNLRTLTQPAAHTRFVFVKTHKTGSSTVANLLHTYAVRNNLSVVALPQTLGGLGQRWNLRNPAVQRAVRAANPGGEADLWFFHVNYHHPSFLSQLVPRAHYLTIVREPVARWISAVGFYDSRNLYESGCDINAYVARVGYRGGPNSRRNSSIALSRGMDGPSAVRAVAGLKHNPLAERGLYSVAHLCIRPSPTHTRCRNTDAQRDVLRARPPRANRPAVVSPRRLGDEAAGQIPGQAHVSPLGGGHGAAAHLVGRARAGAARRDARRAAPQVQPAHRRRHHLRHEGGWLDVCRRGDAPKASRLHSSASHALLPSPPPP